MSFLTKSVRHLFSSTLIIRSSTCSRSLQTSCRLNEIFTIQDEQDFEKRVLKSDIPVVVDFYASWCGPCKILAPRIESIVGSNQNVHLAKINVDDNDGIAEKFEVQSIPTVVGIKNGKAVNQFVGVKDEDEIRSFVDTLLIK